MTFISFSFSSLLFFFYFSLYSFSYNFLLDRSTSMLRQYVLLIFLSTSSDNTYLCSILFFYAHIYACFFPLYTCMMHDVFLSICACLLVVVQYAPFFSLFYPFSSYFHFSLLMKFFNDNFSLVENYILLFIWLLNYLFSQYFYFRYIVFVLYIYNIWMRRKRRLHQLETNLPLPPRVDSDPWLVH